MCLMVLIGLDIIIQEKIHNTGAAKHSGTSMNDFLTNRFEELIGAAGTISFILIGLNLFSLLSFYKKYKVFKVKILALMGVEPSTFGLRSRSIIH